MTATASSAPHFRASPFTRRTRTPGRLRATLPALRRLGRPGNPCSSPAKGVVLMRGCGDRIGRSRYTTETYAQAGSCGAPAALTSSAAGAALIHSPFRAGALAVELPPIRTWPPGRIRPRPGAIMAAMAAGSEERRRYSEVA